MLRAVVIVVKLASKYAIYIMSSALKNVSALKNTCIISSGMEGAHHSHLSETFFFFKFDFPPKIVVNTVILLSSQRGDDKNVNTLISGCLRLRPYAHRNKQAAVSDFFFLPWVSPLEVNAVYLIFLQTATRGWNRHLHHVCIIVV